VKSYGEYLWLDPGEPESARRTLEVIVDVTRRYDIDGVHIDDYFYPYPEKDEPFPDGNVYRRYGGGLTLNDWRRKNVDDFVRDVYKAIHEVKPWVQFGVSPFGVYRPGIPATITAGVDQDATLYADPLKWLRAGWLDYLAPQLYWPIAQKPQSFPVLLDWWRSENPAGRHVWPGLFTSRLLPGEALGKYSTTEIVRQIELTRRTGDAGHIHFSMKALTENAHGLADTLRGKLYAEDALPPATPWLDGVAPKTPVLGARTSWQDGDSADPAFRHVLWLRVRDRWSVRVLPGNVHGYPSDGIYRPIAVAAVDRSGNVSAPAFFPTGE
jgi:uncharacterized lipoprotein YddW (UPF0748 family)